MRHYFFKPSKAATWVFCPASLFLGDNGDGSSSAPQADEGRRCHALAQEFIDLGLRALLPGSIDDIDCGENPRHVVTAAYEYAKRALAICRTVRVFGGEFLGVEKTIESTPLLGGTPDFWVFDWRSNDLIIMDLKFGFGVVEPFENWPLIAYALLITGSLGLDKIADDTNVIFKIYQPRAPHIDGAWRNWRVTIAELRPYFDRITKAVNVALKNPHLACSGVHCRYCDGALKCEALKTAAHNAVDVTFMDRSVEPTPGQLSVELDILKHAEQRLKTRIDAVSAEVEAQLTAGNQVPNWSIGYGRGARQWSIAENQAVLIAQSYGADIRRDGIDTPKQAINKGVPEEIVNAYSEYKQGKHRLVRSDGTRAAQLFSKGEKSD